MPPTSVGNGSPNRPMPAIWSSTTSSSAPPGPSPPPGGHHLLGEARTILRNSSCSGVSSRSIGTPLWDGTARCGVSWATRPCYRPRSDRGHTRDRAGPGRRRGGPRCGRRPARPAGRGPRAGAGGGRLLEHRAVEELAGGVAGLDQAVGVADQAVAGAQVALALVGLGAEAERGGHLDQPGAGAQGAGWPAEASRMRPSGCSRPARAVTKSSSPPSRATRRSSRLRIRAGPAPPRPGCGRRP